MLILDTLCIYFSFQVIDYIEGKYFQTAAPRHCFSSAETMKDFAEKMVKYQEYLEQDPEETDLTQLKSVASIELMKVNTKYVY